MVSAKNLYLFSYNASVGAAWAWVLYRTHKAAKEAPGDYVNMYKEVELPLKLAQTPALMEILHAAIGIVRSPVVVTALQVSSRIWILWGIIALAPQAISSDWVQLAGPIGLSLRTLMGAWGTTEVIRYAFLAFKSIGVEPPYPLTWARYSSFLPLYPIGVASELAMVRLAYSTIKQRRLLSVDLPNPVNLSFDYSLICLLIVFSYVPFFPKMFGHMLSQRKKVLGGRRAVHAKIH